MDSSIDIKSDRRLCGTTIRKDKKKRSFFSLIFPKGVAPSQAVLTELKTRIEGLSGIARREKLREAPSLAVVIVGKRKDSCVYVKIKRRVASQIGLDFRLVELEENVNADDLLQTIRNLNNDSTVDGIIVQVPLPDHLDVELCQEIDPAKDVDGFHFMNIGKLALKRLSPLFAPCTPRGIMELLDYYEIEITGRNVVILGRSNIVGLPLSLMMLDRDATVTICHSKTPPDNVLEFTRRADIVVCAMGRPKCVCSKWVKKDAVIIDVGTTAVEDPEKSSGYKFQGDVHIESVIKETESKFTPVPGGVGPMTVCMLMKACVEAYERYIARMNKNV